MPAGRAGSALTNLHQRPRSLILSLPLWSDLPFASNRRNHDGMSTVRLIKHEVVPNCGSYEVRFSDGRPSVYFYWDDIAGPRIRPGKV